MKKILSLLLALLLILPLFPTVFAEEDDKKDEVKITSVQIDITTPAPGGKVHIPVAADVTVKAGDETLSSTDGAYTVTASWRECESMDGDGSTEPLKEGDAYVAKKTYQLEMTLTLTEGKLPDLSSVLVRLNGKTVKKASDEFTGGFGVKGENTVMLKKEYTCFPSDLTSIQPVVSTVKVDGQNFSSDHSVEKEYDGKEVVLTVDILNKQSGVSYTYQWQKDGKDVAGRTEEALKLRNVADTGEWSCTVAAFYTENPTVLSSPTHSPKKSVKITPHSIKLILEDAQKNLYDKDPAFTYTILGEAYDELVGSIERVQGETIGNYPLLLGTLAFPDEVKDNYFISVQQGSLTILEAGQTAFSAVSGILNGAQIYGDQNSNFRASATTGALPEDSNLIFNRVESDTDKETLAQSSSKSMLKCFTVSAKDKNDQAVTLPKHAALQILIPLTKDEAASYVKNTMTVKLLMGKTVKDLKAEEVITGEVKYLSVLLEEFGTVGVFAGDELPPVTVGGDTAQDTTPDGEGDSGTLWLWVMIAALVVIAVGAIVFTVIWTGKNSPAARPVPPAPTSPKKTAPRGSVGKSAPRRGSCDETRAVPTTPKKVTPTPKAEPAPAPKAEPAPVTKAEHAATEPAKKEKEEITPPAPKKPERDPMVFSFEDLEEE